jgi:NitT/TauT family transport system ATP-binding protein
MQPAGVRAVLDVAIESKVFTSANGARTEVIADLAFQVGDGRFACLIGPSGCGKTTTLRAILGLDRDYRGTILLPAGADPVGVVFQEPRLLPWRTVEENVRLALPDSRTHDLDGLFALLGLADLRSHYPAELSLGLARRVALARAFAVEPGLLVLDEPFASLDGATAERMRRLLVTVWEARPTTALMVTHDLAEAVALADDVIVLSDRPSRVLGIQPVTVARGDRSPAVIAQLVGQIVDRFALAGPVSGFGAPAVNPAPDR